MATDVWQFDRGTVVVPVSEQPSERIVGLVIGEGAFPIERRVLWISTRRGVFVSLEDTVDLVPGPKDWPIGDLDQAVTGETVALLLGQRAGEGG